MRHVHLVLSAILPIALACGGSDSAGPPSSNAVASVVVTATASSMQVGQSVQFTADARTSAGTAVTANNVTWAVSPSGVASISSSGLLTATSAGNATVSATVQGVVGNLSIPISDVGIPSVVNVFMPGNSFSPFNVSVRVNGMVRFEFPSSVHNVIFANRAGAPSDIQQTANVTVNRTFGTVGVFPYDCTLHVGMSGQVTVVQ